MTVTVRKVRNVLIVGAGIAGSTLAVLLGRRGVAVTLVEHADGQRSSGGPVDVRGDALDVVTSMGLVRALRSKATHVKRLTLVGRDGKVVGWIPTQVNADAIEIARTDLARILLGAVDDSVELIYGDTIESLHDDGNGVDVQFARSPSRRFDLVVGADGVHSRVRRIAFGPEHRYVSPLNMYIATVPLDTMAPDPQTVFLHNQPGRAALIHPTTGREGAAFIFRLPPVARVDPILDRQRCLDLLTGAYSGMGWRVPEMLQQFRAADDLYLDSIDRVRVDTWSRGCVVLVGDAAGCVSVFGEGSSLAIVGAAALAQAITTQTDLSECIRRYEMLQRKRINARHRGTGLTAHFLIPRSHIGAGIRNGAFKLWPRMAPKVV